MPNNEYMNLCYEYKIPHDDAIMMGAFIEDTSDKEAKALIKDIQKGLFEAELYISKD